MTPASLRLTQHAWPLPWPPTRIVALTTIS
jgi:hypothetical protein